MAVKKTPNPIDVHVGSRVRMRRTMLSMSQEKLGEKLGITFQQVQKYEKGANRIGASRLQHIADILQVPPGYFFEDSPGVTQTSDGFMDGGSNSTYLVDFISSSEGLTLNRSFSRISDPKIRKRIVDLVETLAANPSLTFGEADKSGSDSDA